MFLLALFVAHVWGHSWIACTDYQDTPDLQHPYNPTNLVRFSNYDTSKCQGFPRGWHMKGAKDYPGTPWGQEYFEYAPNNGGWGGQGTAGTCQTPAQEYFYQPQFPMATYRQGQTVNVVWPAKGHVPKDCAGSNNYQRDHFNAVYISPKKATVGTADPTQTIMASKPIWFSAAEFPHQYSVLDEAGYGNCPNFCSTPDTAPCFGQIKIPSDLAPGNYTFQWLWQYNNQQEEYRTCWDALVLAATTTPPTTPPVTLPPGRSPPTHCVHDETVLTGDAVHLTNPPYQVTATGTYALHVKYSSTADRQIMINVGRGNSTTMIGDYGSVGAQVRATQGELDLSLTINGSPVQADDYIIRTAIFDQAAYDANPNTATPLEQEFFELVIGNVFIDRDPDCGGASRVIAGMWGLVLFSAWLLL